MSAIDTQPPKWDEINSGRSNRDDKRLSNRQQRPLDCSNDSDTYSHPLDTIEALDKQLRSTYPLPLLLGGSLTIISFGQYQTVKDKYPIGFTCRKGFKSFLNNGCDTVYTTSIKAADLIQVIPDDAESQDDTIETKTISGAWVKVIQRVAQCCNKVRDRLSISCPLLMPKRLFLSFDRIPRSK